MARRANRPTPDLSDSTLVQHPLGYFVDTATGMVLSRVGHVDNYGYERLRRPGVERGEIKAHRLVWEAIHGPIPDGLEINHLDGVKDNNHPTNLELADRSRQTSHAYEIGLRSRDGHTGPRKSKLTQAQIDEIRAIPENSCTGAVDAIAARFGISPNYASAIRGGRKLHAHR